MNEKNKNIKRASVFALLVGMMVISYFSASYLMFNIDDENEGKSWKPLPTVMATDNTVTNGQDGIVNVYIYPIASKSHVDGSGGASAMAEGTAYEHGDADGWTDGEELQDSTPIGANYFIAIEVQFSDKAYNTTSSDWDITLVKAEITCAELSLSATTMEKSTDFYDQDGTSDAVICFYVDNSDAGWTMTTGNSITVSDLDIYYYG